mgnify:CR=1 FL=1
MKRANQKTGKLPLKNFTVAKYDRAEFIKGGGNRATTPSRVTLTRTK